jgi:hypothetical protein
MGLNCQVIFTIYSIPFTIFCWMNYSNFLRLGCTCSTWIYDVYNRCCTLYSVHYTPPCCTILGRSLRSCWSTWKKYYPSFFCLLPAWGTNTYHHNTVASSWLGFAAGPAELLNFQLLRFLAPLVSGHIEWFLCLILLNFYYIWVKKVTSHGQENWVNSELGRSQKCTFIGRYQ